MAAVALTAIPSAEGLAAFLVFDNTPQGQSCRPQYQSSHKYSPQSHDSPHLSILAGTVIHPRYCPHMPASANKPKYFYARGYISVQDVCSPRQSGNYPLALTADTLRACPSRGFLTSIYTKNPTTTTAAATPIPKVPFRIREPIWYTTSAASQANTH